MSALSAHHAEIPLIRSGPAGPLRRRRVRGAKRLAITFSVVAALLIPIMTSAPALASSGPANNYACYPLSVPSYYQGEINNLINVTLGICSAIPQGTYGQTSGYSTVGGAKVWFYVQQNPDGYTQLQMSGPSYWWAYWQQNPPDASHGGCSWYQEQVNTWKGGPYYFTTGWTCP